MSLRLRIHHDNDIWEILSEGDLHDGKVYCHLKSTTRGYHRSNGWMFIQILDWIPQEKILGSAITLESFRRKDFLKKGFHECVPWRGANGDTGSCIYCGKSALEGK